MKRSPIIGQRSHATGDIKLAATLKTMGVPPDPHRSVDLILKEDGTQYASFHLLGKSADGRYDTSTLMGYWTRPHTAPSGHPMKAVMAFIKDSPEGCAKATDWLNFAHEWLGRLSQRPPDAPKRIEDIPAFVARHPDDLAGYIFAFAYNRDSCWLDYLEAAKSPDIMMTKGKAITKVNTSTPKHIANELISRLNG
jgi:hypothetical protein